MRTDSEIRQQISRLRKELRLHRRKALKLPARRRGRGCWDRDEEAKKRLGYTNASSYVRRDGSEVLKGEDWTKRKQKLRERSGGICEFTATVQGIPIPMWCAKAATIPAHIIPRHPKRDDRLSNLMHYCIEHDRLTEKQSWRKVRWTKKV